jgi:sulfopyruvate decarboxylase subunit alpha
VCAGLSAVGIRHVVYVPDNPLSHVLRELDARYADIKTILATREEEAFGIAAGLYLGGARPAVLLQSSGLGNSLNALASLLLPYQIPVLMIISMRGDASEWNAAQVPMGRAVPLVLDGLGIRYLVAGSETKASVEALGATAFGTRMPAACLLPRQLTTTTPAPATEGS